MIIRIELPQTCAYQNPIIEKENISKVSPLSKDLDAESGKKSLLNDVGTGKLFKLL